MAFDYKKCCNAKGQRFRYLSKTHFRTYLWLLYSESRKGLYCKYCATFTTSSVKCSVGKNRQKPGKLVIAPVCSFNKLKGFDGYLYGQDKLEYHKLMIIEVRL